MKITRNLPQSYRTIPWRQWRRAHIVRNHAVPQRGLGGSQSVSSWGQYASFWRSGHEKKHELSLQKLTFCSRARWAAAHRRIVNKIKDLLFSSIKITSLDRNDRDRLRNVGRLHSPVELEPPGAGGLGGPWRRCFFFQLVGLCERVLALQEEERGEKKY